MVIRVEWNQTGLRRRVEAWMNKQMPFVLKTALDLTVLEAQEELRKELPSSFTIRNTRTARGVRVSFASKSVPEASVGTIDEYMRPQVVGGSPARQMAEAIPMLGRGRPRSKKTSKTLQSKWPGAIRRKNKGSFWRSGRGGAQLLFLPRGKNRLILAYVISPTIKIKKTDWQPEEILESIARSEWIDNVKIAWAKAIKTARR